MTTLELKCKDGTLWFDGQSLRWHPRKADTALIFHRLWRYPQLLTVGSIASASYNQLTGKITIGFYGKHFPQLTTSVAVFWSPRKIRAQRKAAEIMVASIRNHHVPDGDTLADLLIND